MACNSSIIQPCQELTRLPLSSEWARFEFYSHRIKELGHWRFEFADHQATNHCSPADVCLRRRVTFGVVACLALSRQSRWILPNLTSLRWNRDDWPYTDLLSLFLGPNLTRLAIGYNAAPEEHSGALESRLPSQITSIPDICPTLTQLEIYPSQPKSVIDAAVIFALQCPKLESFLISSPEPWPVPFIQHLSRQPFLREVRLRMDTETSCDLAFLHTASLHYPFPSLQILSVMVPSLTPCVKLIQMMRTCRLTTAIFHLTDHVFPSEIADLFAALLEHCSTATLQVVEIHRPSKCDWNLSDEDAFHLAHLESLLRFPHMRSFTIETPLIVDIDNNDLKAIADAWPLLVSLLFMDGWGFMNLPEITWAGVGYLLWKCPQLIYLSISLDSRIDDVALTTSLPSFRPNTHLRFLWVTDSVLDDVEVFAHSLFAIAPLIVGIDGHGHENETLEISVPLANPSAFLDHVESLMWELRRTRMRDQFAFLDEYGQFVSLLPSLRACHLTGY